MSIPYEVDIEFAADAADELMEKFGETPKLTQIRAIIGDAWTSAENLPKGVLYKSSATNENIDEAIRRLNESVKILTQAENEIPVIDEKIYENLRNKIKVAKTGVAETIEMLRAMKH